jgi:hypothetical protein
MGMQLGGEDCPGLWGQTAGTTAEAGIACEGIGMAKMAISRVMPLGMPPWSNPRSNHSASMKYFGHVEGLTNTQLLNLKFQLRAMTGERMCVCQKPSQWLNFLRF